MAPFHLPPLSPPPIQFSNSSVEYCQRSVPRIGCYSGHSIEWSQDYHGAVPDDPASVVALFRQLGELGRDDPVCLLDYLCLHLLHWLLLSHVSNAPNRRDPCLTPQFGWHTEFFDIRKGCHSILCEFTVKISYLGIFCDTCKDFH